MVKVYWKILKGDMEILLMKILKNSKILKEICIHIDRIQDNSRRDYRDNMTREEISKVEIISKFYICGKSDIQINY
jgi:hypothetical protein